jgi:hypothetical protein
MATKHPPLTAEEQKQRDFAEGLRAAEKANYQDVLRSSVVRVTFKKVNGDIRIMKCTLKPSLLPPEPAKNEDGTVKKDFSTTVPVFDLEKTAWRSFRIDEVIDFEIVEE